MRTLDGRLFWAPHEGLTAACNLLRLSHCHLECGVIEFSDCSKPVALRMFSHLTVLLQSLRNRFTDYIGADYRFQAGRSNAKPKAKLLPQDAATLAQVRTHAEFCRSRSLKLTKLAIDYPKVTVVFTSESYYDFIFRSLDAADHWVRTGELMRPRADQRY